MRFIFLIFVCLSHIAAAQNDHVRKEIQKIIRYDTDLDFAETPGFVVGIIDGDSLMSLGFGEYDKLHAQELNKLIFELGSITKVLTSSLLQNLDAKGFLSVDDPVNTYIHPQYQNPRLQSLTIQDLIDHYSGFPRRPQDFGVKEVDIHNPYAYYSEEDLLKYYAEYIPSEDFFQKFSYSHINYALLTIVIQRATGQRFDSVLKSLALKPLNMSNSFIQIPENKRKNVVQGYTAAGKTVPPWTYSSFGGSEGLKSCLGDLFYFVQSLINDDEVNDWFLDIENENLRATDFNKYIQISNGWFVLQNKGNEVFTHTGKTSGHSSYIGLVKNTKTAVIVLSNSSVGTKDLGYLILRMINNNWKRKA